LCASSRFLLSRYLASVSSLLAGGAAARRGETPVIVENAWPAIVDRDTFQRIRRKLGSRSPKAVHPRRVPSTFLLSGLLFCSCGRAMTGCSAKSGRHFYYICCRNSKQGQEACDARMIPKEKVERQVIEQLRAKVLTEENLEKLVMIVNEELQTFSSSLNERLEVVDAELRDARARLAKLYEALETGKLDLDALAPRIKELKVRQDELSKARVLLEAEMAARGVQPVDEVMVKSYAQDLRGLLEEAELTERRAFLRSFVNRIEVDKGQVTVYYKLPLPQVGKASEPCAVLPTVTSGGPGGTRTPDLLTARYLPLYGVAA
jgi:site-specific DNA recombinase